MTDPAEQLRRTFEAYQDQTPDPAQVYARVQELARGYRWRRRGAQVAGGAVLGAGLIAGLITLPGLLPARPGDNVAAVAPGALPPAANPAESPVPSESPSATRHKPGQKLSEAELAQGWEAYFGAGYGYDDAVQLAKIWKSKAQIGDVKAEAGQRLLAGETLPVKPHPNSSDPSAPAAGGAATKEAKRVDAFFGAGYDYEDAVKLAKLWKTSDPYAAKVLGGKKILAGETLPIKP